MQTQAIRDLETAGGARLTDNVRDTPTLPSITVGRRWLARGVCLNEWLLADECPLPFTAHLIGDTGKALVITRQVQLSAAAVAIAPRKVEGLQL
jgi:hypothetical protein